MSAFKQERTPTARQPEFEDISGTIFWSCRHVTWHRDWFGLTQQSHKQNERVEWERKSITRYQYNEAIKERSATRHIITAIAVNDTSFSNYSYFFSPPCSFDTTLFFGRSTIGTRTPEPARSNTLPRKQISLTNTTQLPAVTSQTSAIVYSEIMGCVQHGSRFHRHRSVPSVGLDTTGRVQRTGH